ncbi:MAG: NAD(P)-binding domain-containing protein, partial [Leptospiraceae bacterium]|nr:NAD(P)-binding domain-containing protein [Leptospiraceae bacterium]
KKGHKITVGARNKESNSIVNLKQNLPEIEIKSIGESVKDSDVILISANIDAVKSISEEIKSNLKDQVIIDAMNSVRSKPSPFENSFEALKAYTGHLEIVKCFNSTGFENMENPIYVFNDKNIPIDMFMAGNSVKAKQIAKNLALDCGFGDCIDFGGDDKVPLLESFALTWINLAFMQGKGRNFAFKVLER